MADESKTVTISKSTIEALVDEPHALFVFFDGIGPRGHVNGLILLSISAARQMPSDNANEVLIVPTVVAHLRTNIQGAIGLRDALDEAIAMATAGSVPQGKPN